MMRYLKNFDWIMITAVFSLVCFGLLSVHSSSIGKGDFSSFNKQVVFFVIGALLMFLLSFVDWRIFRENPYLIFTIYVAFLLLLLGLFFFAPEIRGVKSWYRIGDFSLDPVEFMKIILIILLAKYFSVRHIEIYQKRHIMLSGFYVALPSFLVFLQPNLGSVLILISIWVGVLIIAGIKFRHFLLLLLCGLLIVGLGWNFILKDYQKQRIISFIHPQIEPLGIGWNQNQSEIAIGSGGLLGKGFGHGSQTQYGFLPEAQNDFVFAAIAEETGLFGILILMSLFFILLWRIFKIALTSDTNFSRLFATGLAMVLISQIFINIGMNLGILPIIGISLPLVSYGGSGLIALMAGFGILLSIKTHP